LARVIGSGNGFTKIVQSHIREQALARMLHSSPMAIFPLLLGRSPPPLCNSGVVGSEWLGLMAGVASEFKTTSKRERTIDGKRFWLICIGAGVLRPRVTNPARTLAIPRGDCQYRSLRVTHLMPDRPLCPPQLANISSSSPCSSNSCSS